MNFKDPQGVSFFSFAAVNILTKAAEVLLWLSRRSTAHLGGVGGGVAAGAWGSLPGRKETQNRK